MSNSPSKEYKMIKNYMHNECDISKKYIENLVENEIKNIITKKLKNVSIEEIIEREIVRTLCRTYNGLSYDTKLLVDDAERSIKQMRDKAIEKAIADNIIVSLKEKVQSHVIKAE